MSIADCIPAVEPSLSIIHGTVLELTEDGLVVVASATSTSIVSKFLCRFMLDANGFSTHVVPGDLVLVMAPSGHEQMGCVLGKIGSYNPPDSQRVQIEAAQEVSLRCGDASITLRSDGKILTKAVDIASLAKRVNKVRGGSVQIN